MSLKAWLEDGHLKKAEPTGADVRERFEVAIRDLKDAGIAELSVDTRFRLAYEAVLAVAQALMLADGFRPASLDNHYYSIESLEHTMGEDRKSLTLLHAMSKKGSLLPYGQVGAVSPEELATMLREAQRILKLGVAMLGAKHPEYLEE